MTAYDKLTATTTARWLDVFFALHPGPRQMGWGEDIQRQGHEPTNTLNESPQHRARPLSTGGHTTLHPCEAPTDFVSHTTIPLTSESWWPL
jgi:hypothetical protein